MNIDLILQTISRISTNRFISFILTPFEVVQINFRRVMNFYVNSNAHKTECTMLFHPFSRSPTRQLPCLKIITILSQPCVTLLMSKTYSRVQITWDKEEWLPIQNKLMLDIRNYLPGWIMSSFILSSVSRERNKKYWILGWLINLNLTFISFCSFLKLEIFAFHINICIFIFH